jgi:hypothetical protein
MNESIRLLLYVSVAIIFAFIGSITMSDNLVKDCQTNNYFRVDNKVFECKEVNQK